MNSPEAAGNKEIKRMSDQLTKRSIEQWNNRAAERRNGGEDPTWNPDERRIRPELCHWAAPTLRRRCFLVQESKKHVKKFKESRASTVAGTCRPPKSPPGCTWFRYPWREGTGVRDRQRFGTGKGRPKHLLGDPAKLKIWISLRHVAAQACRKHRRHAFPCQ